MNKLKAFAERISPRQFNFSPMMTAIVGAIIGFDYGVRNRKGGHLTSISITSDGFLVASSTASSGGGAFLGTAEDMERNLREWLKELSAEDRTEFDRIYKTRVIDYRSGASRLSVYA